MPSAGTNTAQAIGFLDGDVPEGSVQAQESARDAIETDEWTFQKTNLLLNEFGLEPLDENWQGSSVADAIANISEPALIEV